MEEQLVAKKKKFTLHSPLPVQELHAVFSSERYLLTTDGVVSDREVHIAQANSEVREDGTVAARVEMVQAVPVNENAGGEEGGVEKTETNAPKELRIEQTTTVSPVEQNRQGMTFRFSTITPLAGMGTMFTDMQILPDSTGQGSDVETEVKVDTSIPIIGGKLAKHLLENSEQTVEKGLKRALYLVENPVNSDTA